VGFDAVRNQINLTGTPLEGLGIGSAFKDQGLAATGSTF